MGESRELTVAIPFVRVEASQNPNLALSVGDDAALPYFRSMVVAFASFIRFNPKVQLKLVSNGHPPAEVSGAFTELGVETLIAPFDHRPPAGFTDKFEASLFLLDALEALDGMDALLVDPDVLCVGDLGGMLNRAGRRVGAMSIDYEADHPVHGLTRAEAGTLHGLLGEPHPSPTYFGGEAYFVPAEHSALFRKRAKSAWDLSLSRHTDGESKFVTEEHVLAYALRGVPVADLDGDVKRIWTARRFRNVDGTERDLTLWHLPAEKNRGFTALYEDAKNRDSWFWKGTRDEFLKRSGRAMGVNNRTAGRFVTDTAAQVLSKWLII